MDRKDEVYIYTAGFHLDIDSRDGKILVLRNNGWFGFLGSLRSHLVQKDIKVVALWIIKNICGLAVKFQCLWFNINCLTLPNNSRDGKGWREPSPAIP